MVIRPVGEFDFASYERFRQFWRALVFEPGETIAFDLSDLDFIDGDGVQALRRCVNRLRAAGARVEITNLNPAIARTFDLVGERRDTFPRPR